MKRSLATMFASGLIITALWAGMPNSVDAQDATGRSPTADARTDRDGFDYGLLGLLGLAGLMGLAGRNKESHTHTGHNRTGA